MCEPSILIVVVVARAGLFTVRQIREWATYVFIYFYFALRHRPPFVTSVAPSSVLRWRRLCNQVGLQVRTRFGRLVKPVNRLIQNMTQNVKTTSSVSEFARSLLS